MDIFGIGVLELFFIVLLALIVLGPKDMVKAGRSMGKFIRKILLMPGFMEAQRWVRNFPAQLIREAGIEDIQKDLQSEAEKIREATTVSVDGGQTVVAGAVSRPPAPAPVQATSAPTEQAGEDGSEEWEETGEPVLMPPHLAAAQADLPPEWLVNERRSAPTRPVAPARKKNLDDFPAEWTSPPPRTGPTYPPPFPSKAPSQNEATQD
jgi:sec-independent protein translocase protein TatB